jgi:5-methylcytosine-specific restriction endonuclease McrA
MISVSDCQTIISDITDINTEVSFEIEDKIVEIKDKINNELNKLNSDNLKEKCKELSITGVSKFKKLELVQVLEAEFMKLISILKDKKTSELKNICKQYGIKGLAIAKKNTIIYNILLYTSSNMIFKCDTINNDKVTEKPTSLIEQLEKQKLDIELKMNEEIKRQEEEQIIKDLENKRNAEIEENRIKAEEIKRQEEENRIKAEEIKRQEEENRIKAEEIKRQEEEKKEAKKKKQSIPKNVRVIIWNHYIGEDIIKHKCLCCKKVTISNTNFEVGHVISEKNNGTHEINNLRPICFSCNHSMGAENMIDFVIKFGLYIG